MQLSSQPTEQVAAMALPDPLREYRAKRDPTKTPEPMSDSRRRRKGNHPIFVVQEHHARALHWDFRLEHDGVLVSWALPKGIPEDPAINHLAIHTEDHPLSYGSFEGEIPAGEYGGGRICIWDSGTFECEKWTPNEIKVVLHGTRTQGRFVLFATKGKNWMIHRMESPQGNINPLPARVRPMLATPAALPADDFGWAYEVKWDGVRAIAFVEGGRVRLQSRNILDLSVSFPELQELGRFLGSRTCALDGEIIVLGANGHPDFGLLQHRLHTSKRGTIQNLSVATPASFVVFDVVHLDGHSLMTLPYDERRKVLESMGLSGPSFTTTESFRGVNGTDVLRATTENGLEGVIAKRRNSTYVEGKRSDNWLKIKNVRTQEVVIGGWTVGKGNRARSLGALLLGIPAPEGLRFVGKVGTGFNARDLDTLQDLLRKVPAKKNPFEPQSDVVESSPPNFVRLRHVGEVQFSGWTAAGRLRHPTWRGLRLDKTPADVKRETHD
jgi:bifunctional non-homologous end joining protein LigD